VSHMGKNVGRETTLHHEAKLRGFPYAFPVGLQFFEPSPRLVMLEHAPCG
jgi:hypothetical protein